jgi:ferrochelatase
MADTGPAVVLVNLGTPDQPTPRAVRRYLKQFLSDRRVVEAPRFIWFWVLRLFILPFRPRSVAEGYSEIWRDDSPIREITRDQAHKLQQRVPATVDWAMSYGEPALPDVLDRLADAGHESILVIPLYPQYSSSTVGAVMDGVARWIGKRRELPAIQIVRDYWEEPAWQKAMAESIRRFQADHGVPERLLFSFHGIPKSYEKKGDRYAERCRASADAIARHLGLEDDQWQLTFQSRFGPTEWLQPYTDETLTQWARDGVRDVQVVCPGFAADCLETLEEICVENRDYFLENGGTHFAYIPALNADDAYIDALEIVTKRWLPGCHE